MCKLFDYSMWIFFSCYVVALAVCGFKILTAKEHGALYINQDGVNVYICDGVLKIHGEKTMRRAFYCDDGTIVENLVNFTIKEK